MCVCVCVCVLHRWVHAGACVLRKGMHGYICMCILLQGEAALQELQQHIIQLLQVHGPALVSALVTGFTLLPVYLSVDSSEVLWLLLSRYKEVT